MRIDEALDRLDSYDNELTIYVIGGVHCDPASEAVVAHEGADGEAPAAAQGMEYLLDVGLAKNAIDVWCKWRRHWEPSKSDKYEAVLYYARNDAYMPVEDCFS